MAIFRRLMWLIFGGVLGLLCLAWYRDYASVSSTTAVESKQTHPVQLTPSVQPQAPVQPKSQQSIEVPEARKIRFKTDVLAGVIDLQGGHLVQLELLQYPRSNDAAEQTPVNLLDHSHARYHVAQTDLIAAKKVNLDGSHSTYQSDQPAYALTDNNQALVINLYRQENGVKLKKQFVFKRGDYQVDVKYHVHNQSETPWVGRLYAQLQQQGQSKSSSWLSSISAYVGGAISTEQKPYEKLKLDKMGGATLPKAVQQGWISFVESYFASAWISQIPQMAYYSQHQDGRYTLGMMSPQWTVMPTQTAHYEVSLYAGPKIAERLDAAAKNLGLIVDYGMFWWAANVLVWLLKQCYRVLGNWGWAIVAMTILVKLAFYRISAKSIRHMIVSQRLQPELDDVQKRYSDDFQKVTEARAALYRREGVKQRDGFLPLLIQLPIQFSLFWILRDNVELRHASFLWIRDLEAVDPYYILVICLGLVAFVEQKLMPPPTVSNASHDNMTPFWLPVLGRAVIGYVSPAGLVLYFLVEGIFSALQKWWILGRPNVLKQLIPRQQ